MARWPGIARWLAGRDPSVFGPMARRGSIADDPINSCGPIFSRTEADLKASVEGPSGMGGPARESFDSPPVWPFDFVLQCFGGFTRSTIMVVCLAVYCLGREKLKERG